MSIRQCNRLIRLAAALLLTAAPAVAAAADITVETDRDPVAVNASFQISFIAEGDVDGDPDFSPLEKDFQVLGTSQSSSFSMGSGGISQSKTWTLTVLARRTGTINIPAIAFGDEKSPPRTITVQESVAGGAGNRDDILLHVDIDPNDPYVQQQAVFRVRLFRSVETANATLSEPELEGGSAVIEKLDDENRYETRLNGRRYEVLERKYAVFPQTSGPITIRPIVFRGQVQQGRRSLFRSDPFGAIDPFGPAPRTVVRQSEPVTLEVKPIPAGFQGSHWLPARNLNLTEIWSEDPPAFQQGEPATRTLTITADGLTAGQLPELPEWVPDGFKSYPDQPLLNDSVTSTSLVGARQEKTALIPAATGEFVLPALEIPWWNVQTDSLEYARLPERRITVAPAAQPGASLTPPSPPAPQVEAGGSDAETGETAVAPEAAVPQERGFWFWISVGLGAAWLLTLLAWWAASRRATLPVFNGGGRERTLRELSRHLKRACAANDAAAVKAVLLQWGVQRWHDDPPRSLGDIAARSGGALASELQHLNGALYGRRGRDWNGAALWEAFAAETAFRGEEAGGARPDLEPLHRIK